MGENMQPWLINWREQIRLGEGGQGETFTVNHADNSGLRGVLKLLKKK